MKTPMPINPNILRWARETAGLDVEAVARKMDRDISEILAWESGKSSPTYPQLETLAYKIYSRPLAVFFFPEPPQEETPKQFFRTLPEEEIDVLPPRLRFLIRDAKVKQLNLAELYDNINPSSRHIVRDLRFSPKISANEMSVQVREYLNVDLSTQKSWKDFDKAFKNWRNILEGN